MFILTIGTCINRNVIRVIIIRERLQNKRGTNETLNIFRPEVRPSERSPVSGRQFCIVGEPFFFFWFF